MAITIKGSPDVFAPAFNPMYFYLDSDNKDKEGFKYIFDIYKTGTAELITSISPYPRPIDGYGVCDLSQIIKSQLSEDIQQIKGPRDTPPVYSCFDIEFGEEYIQSWNFTDNFFVTSGPFESFLGFTGTGGTQPYIVGDFILVEQTIGFEQPAFNGVFEVLSADSNNVIVSSQYIIGGISSTTVNPGVIYFSDKRRTIFPDLTGFTGSCVFNGAVGHQEFMDYDSNDYDTSTNSGATFFTNIPDGYTVRPDNTMRLNFYNSVIPTGATFLNVETQYGVYDLQNENVLGKFNVIGAGSADITFTEPNYINNFGSFPIFKNICYPILFIVDFAGQTLLQGNGTTPWNDISAFDEEFVEFQGENGEAFGAYIVDLPTSDSIVIDYPFSAITSTTGHALQQTRWYEVKIFDSDLGYVTETKRFNVDWTPAFQFGPNVELVFLDRMGSYAPVNFQLQSSRTMNIQRDTYKKVLGNLNAIDISDKWQYNSTDRGMTNINTSVMTELTLNSNWMNETDVAYAKELYSSPRVYIKETDGKLWPVVVKTNSFNIATKYNKKLISISITIQYANDDIINNI
jgi:hypothetical protein